MHDNDSMGGAGLAFLLAEFRDLRKGMEVRDSDLRASIDAVRSDVKELAVSVDRSRGHVDSIRNDIEVVKQDVHELRTDMDSIEKSAEEDRIRKESSWTGPKKAAMTIIFLASLAAAILVLMNFGPQFLAFLAPAAS
jgi:outer membrane murein-binding lipoprotein Lpp